METVDKTLEVVKLFKEIILLLKHNMSKAFENSGITVPQGMLIGFLKRFGKMKLNELSGMLSLSNSTVSGIIDRLEKQEIVERVRSCEDKRVVYVSLSPKWDEMHQDHFKIAEKNIEDIINKGTPEELDEITKGLNVLKKLLSGRK